MEDRITSQIFIVIARIVTRSAADKTLKVYKNAPVYVTGCNGIVYSLPNETQFSTLVDLLHAVFFAGSGSNQRHPPLCTSMLESTP